MLSCEEVSRLVSQSMEQKLSLWRRVNLRLHLSMCQFCSGFAKELRQLQAAAQRHAEQVQRDPRLADVTLSAEARERIRQALESQPPRSQDS